MQEKIKKQKERGQSLTEMALGFTALMFLLAGVADLGRAAFTLITLRDASQEGALYASFNIADIDGVTARAKGSSDTPVDLSSATVTILPDPYPTCAGSGNNVTVTVTLPFSLTMPLIPNFIPNTFNLSSSSNVTILVPPC